MNKAINLLQKKGKKFMELLSFDYQIDEFMMYCKSAQLRQKTMNSYEQALRLFERWCADNFDVTTVDQVNESLIRRYINDLSERGKYSFFVNDKAKEINFPERRRDFRKPISVTAIVAIITSPTSDGWILSMM